MSKAPSVAWKTGQALHAVCFGQSWCNRIGIAAKGDATTSGMPLEGTNLPVP